MVERACLENMYLPKADQRFKSSRLRKVEKLYYFLELIKTMKLTLSILPEKFSICHFDKKSPTPDWANPVPSQKDWYGAREETSFTSITRTRDELSIILPQDKIPGGVMCEKDWRVFKVKGPLGFVLTGIVASLSEPLAEAKISILYVSTYETDYLLVEDKDLEKVKKILRKFCDIK